MNENEVIEIFQEYQDLKKFLENERTDRLKLKMKINYKISDNKLIEDLKSSIKFQEKIDDRTLAKLYWFNFNAFQETLDEQIEAICSNQDIYLTYKEYFYSIFRFSLFQDPHPEMDTIDPRKQYKNLYQYYLYKFDIELTKSNIKDDLVEKVVDKFSRLDLELSLLQDEVNQEYPTWDQRQYSKTCLTYASNSKFRNFIEWKNPMFKQKVEVQQGGPNDQASESSGPGGVDSKRSATDRNSKRTGRDSQRNSGRDSKRSLKRVPSKK